MNLKPNESFLTQIKRKIFKIKFLIILHLKGMKRFVYSIEYLYRLESIRGRVRGKRVRDQKQRREVIYRAIGEQYIAIGVDLLYEI